MQNLINNNPTKKEIGGNKSMKRILKSLAVVIAVGAIAGVATYSFFSDTETSTGNTFTAGSIDLKVDHKHVMYNGDTCDESCVENTSTNLIQNGSFEIPEVTNGDHWQVFNSISPWTVTGTPDQGDTIGLEYQENDIYLGSTAADGTQYVELDGFYPAKIVQDIAASASGKYKISFKYAPRPGHSENKMKVMFGDTEILNASLSSSNPFSWTNFSQEINGPTTGTISISFEETGANDQLGMFLDDVSVHPYDCSYEIDGGTCKLWGLKDLGQGDYFWNFGDVKPGDYGINIISLHAYDNDAYACLFTDNIVDKEETVNDPEIEAGDSIASVVGELSGYIKLFIWEDTDEDNTYDIEETILAGPGAPIDVAMNRISLQKSHTKYFGLAWCAGTQTLEGATIKCDGSSMGNITQTDTMTADITAYAEQQRNNAGFRCSSLP
jgi:predicted ribosomally synthesized peptide with SipW-like signal peptide